jgi:TolA protein
MSTATADNFFADHGKYLVAAFVLHMVIVVLLTVTINANKQVPTPTQVAIKATIVDNSARRIKREKEQAEAARAERERVEAERKQAEELEAQKEEARQEVKRAEEKRQQQVVADKKQKVEAERLAVAKKKTDDDKKRAADVKAKQADKQKSERETREQAQREAELKRQLADEEGRAKVENSSLSADYYASIVARIEGKWNPPASAKAGLECDITVTQGSGGTVMSVQIGKCNGDKVVRDSLETAVMDATPLPPPPDMRLFKRQITFRFKPSH